MHKYLLLLRVSVLHNFAVKEAVIMNAYFSFVLRILAGFLTLAFLGGCATRDTFPISDYTAYQSLTNGLVATPTAVGTVYFGRVGSYPAYGAATAMPGGMQVGALAPAFQYMLPETARELLAKLNEAQMPCASGTNWESITVGAFVGGLIGRLVSSTPKAVLAGMLIGGLGGDSQARMTCSRYGYLGLQLQLVIDQSNHCTGEVRRVNGQVTSDERCSYARRYTPDHLPPQIGKKN